MNNLRILAGVFVYGCGYAILTKGVHYKTEYYS